MAKKKNMKAVAKGVTPADRSQSRFSVDVDLLTVDEVAEVRLLAPSLGSLASDDQLDGYRFTVWLRLRRENPSATLADAGAVLWGDAKAINDIAELTFDEVDELRHAVPAVFPQDLSTDEAFEALRATLLLVLRRENPAATLADAGAVLWGDIEF